jgi:prolipoprotein diacylglyceryltransferase
MLQRIQTVYIILFCAVLFTASFLPFASIVLEDQSTYNFYPTGWDSQSSLEGFKVYPFYSGYLVAVAFGILMLVNFKKRKKQLRYGMLSYFFVLITLVYMFLEVSSVEEFLLVSENNSLKSISYSFSMYLLVASLPIIFLANRAIKKDEKLVSSLDRLR